MKYLLSKPPHVTLGPRSLPPSIFLTSTLPMSLATKATGAFVGPTVRLLFRIGVLIPVDAGVLTQGNGGEVKGAYLHVDGIAVGIECKNLFYFHYVGYSMPNHEALRFLGVG